MFGTLKLFAARDEERTLWDRGRNSSGDRVRGGTTGGRGGRSGVT